MKFAIFILLLFSCFVAKATGDECSTINNQSIAMGPIKDYRSFGFQGSCYAIAASDILSHYYSKPILPNILYNGYGGKLSFILESFQFKDNSTNNYALNFKVNYILKGKSQSMTAVKDAIDKQLILGNILGISFSLKKIPMNMTGRIIDYLGYVVKKENTLHASTIIGRVFSTEKNECLYVIRGTWGQDCGTISNSVCEKGYLYLNFSQLYDAFYEILFIE